MDLPKRGERRLPEAPPRRASTRRVPARRGPSVIPGRRAACGTDRRLLDGTRRPGRADGAAERPDGGARGAFSTRSVISRWSFSRNSCVSCRSKSSSGWEARRRFGLPCASLPRPTWIWGNRCRQAIPERSLLSTQRLPDRDPPVARPARRHSCPRGSLHADACPTPESTSWAGLSFGIEGADGVRLAPATFGSWRTSWSARPSLRARVTYALICRRAVTEMTQLVSEPLLVCTPRRDSVRGRS